MKTFRTKLFYSYCHADKSYREDMQTSLALLKRNGGIDEWHDKELIAGQHFSSKIKEKLEKANIVIFLVSRDFLASDACVEEWNFAKKQAKKTGQKLISIIIRQCAWKDFDDMSDYLALPENGKPVTSWNNKDEAWQSVYDGIKNAVEDIRKTHTLESKFTENISRKKFSASGKLVISETDKDKPTVHDEIKNPVNGIQETFTLKPEFKEKISSIEFVSSEKDEVQLEDLFVFPNISLRSEDDIVAGKPIKTFKEISKNKHAIIRGEDQSGKTVICKKFFLHLVAENKPVIFVNLNTISGKKPQDDIFKKSTWNNLMVIIQYGKNKKIKRLYWTIYRGEEKELSIFHL